MNTGKVISILDATPTCFVAKCEFCGGELDTRVKPVYQWTAMVLAAGGIHLQPSLVRLVDVTEFLAGQRVPQEIRTEDR
jgi:hypothetical protein